MQTDENTGAQSRRREKYAKLRRRAGGNMTEINRIGEKKPCSSAVKEIERNSRFARKRRYENLPAPVSWFRRGQHF